MTDRAIVVGCDAYPHLPGGDLGGAVGDALAMRDWLLNQAARPVPAGRLTFLSSPSSSGVSPEPSIVTGPASIEEFGQAVWAAVTDPLAGEEDRIFVYLAGHGLRTDPGNPVLAQDAFALTNFSGYAPAAGAVTVHDLVARLRQSRFGHIVLILDACRNFPFQRAFQPGGLGLDPEPPLNRDYEPRLYLLQATLPGGVSVGTRDAATGQVRGDFTAALLKGLAGDGIAKTYDEQGGNPYVVRWSALSRYLEAARLRQAPRALGEGDLVLATFPDGYFEPVKLTVRVRPYDLGKVGDLRVKVTYYDPLAYDDAAQEAPGPAPVEFEVPPRRQRVFALVDGAWGKAEFDVYQDSEGSVEVRRDRPLPPVVRTYNWRGGLGISARNFPVSVTSDDPAAVLRLRDASGEIRRSGVRSLVDLVPAGSYTAELIGAAGQRGTAPAEVGPADAAELALPAPGRQSALGLLGFGWRREDLDWASAAAVLAWGISSGNFPASPAEQARLAGGFVLAVAGPREPRVPVYRPDVLGFATVPPPPPRPFTSVVAHSALAETNLVPPEGERPHGPSWWGAVVPQEPPAPGRAVGPGWLTVRLGNSTLTVPRLPSASTVVVLGPRLTVAVYDQSVLAAPRGLALLDRGQSLLAAGERTAAAEVLGELAAAGERGYAAEALRQSANGRSHWHGLAAAIAPADAAGLVGDGPWAAFRDRPAGRPLPAGELASPSEPLPPGRPRTR